MIYLRPMQNQDFELFRTRTNRSYAEAKQKAEDLTQEAAMKSAEMSLAELLPNGFETVDHTFLKIMIGDEDSSDPIGHLWYMVKRPQNMKPFVFICDIHLDEAHRGKRLGEKVMLELEKRAKQEGIDKIRLHVFGNNEPARKLYQRLGFIETNVQMLKNL